jgi:adenosylhomocysteinase
VTTTGNIDVCDSAMLQCAKKGAIVCNIGHFDNEIDTSYMRSHWRWEEIKPQVHQVFRSDADDDYLLLLAEGRLVNLGNATGHPSRIMDGSFANQVLAQIEMYKRCFADLDDSDKAMHVGIELLPKQLDEEVARCMVEGFGGVITKLTTEQAKYIGVPVEGPFKPETYKY